MTASADLTAELRTEVKALQDDLRLRLASQPAVDANWRAQHRQALDRGRTAASWSEWAEERITQAAAAWVLTTVFLRFAEDNDLVAPVWISGDRARRTQALDAQAQFLREQARHNPDVTDREWLEHAISYFAGLPATQALVDDTSALWLVTPSGDAATRLLTFWRETDEHGVLLRDLTQPGLDTRFLGDLYQDLSDEAKERYALLQTPVFVEEFILDRTLDEALKDRPLDGFRLIDPTCGSGHFLLGAFPRLLERWERLAPGMDSRARAQKALDAIHGVDLNPFAVAITRYRLTIAALRASGDKRLEDAPAFAYHLAVGDSLLHGLDQQEIDYGPELSLDRAAATVVYATENLAALQTILVNGRYDAVVGNPPYITVKDKALNLAYRDRYKYLKGTYALTVPFMERFFALAKDGERPGWVGQITSNSFMKREFGVPLIEKFFPKMDLRLVADTSGAFIPGHGTPTVILVGRNTGLSRRTVRAVLGVRGEPGKPADPAKGLVWTAIKEHFDEPGYSDDWITVTDLDRAILAKHPWSLTGGGAVELRIAIEGAAAKPFGNRMASVGFMAVTREDDAYALGRPFLKRRGIAPILWRALVSGTEIRDWSIDTSKTIICTYDKFADAAADTPTLQVLWPLQRHLLARRALSGTQAEQGLEWWEYSQLNSKRFCSPRVIGFAFVATHPQFALTANGPVFIRSAPVVMLPEGSTEDEHLALLGVLNSSAACFWLKQNCHDKGNRGGERSTARYEWEHFYEFTGTTLKDFPLPAALPLARGRSLDSLAQRLAAHTPQAVAEATTPSRASLDDARRDWGDLLATMIGQQEELDWEVYRSYGLLDDDLTYSGDDPPRLALGERAFEIVMARRKEDTAWFDRHGSTPITELPAHWPAAYRALVERRIALIETHPFVRLLERAEYKRRWATEPWEKQEERALRGWLLDRLEDHRFWFDRANVPTPRSVAQLSDDVARDSDLVGVLALWEGRPDVPVGSSLVKLLATEAVPFLAAYRYKAAGLRKRAAWELTWAMQRREDAGEVFGKGTANGPIPIPPKYVTADFARTEYWSHRGKLDVPKERFILYPDAGRDTDPTPVLGWAGWDHAQQAFALDQLTQQRESEGWADARLIPLVAGLAELLPWVEQWHSEPDAFYGGVSPAAFFREQFDDRCRQVEQTRGQLGEWLPAPARRGRAAAR